jgi:hypothetical protein
MLVLAGAAVLAVIVTLRRKRESTPMPRQAQREEDDAIDWDELERAEREVRELDDDGAGGAPEQQKGDEWGPGATGR